MKSFFILFFLFLLFIAVVLYKKKYYYIQNSNCPWTLVYVINLKETDEGQRRWKAIKNIPEFKGKLQRFSGIYGKRYNPSNEIKNNIITSSWNYGKWKYNNKNLYVKMEYGEIGVALSHYKLWKKISNMDKNSKILILEDDAIRLAPNIQQYVSYYMSQLPSDWDIFLLGFWLHKGDDGEKINKDISKVKSFVLMNSYIITPKGAKKLLKRLPINAPLDTWVSMQSEYINIYRHHMTYRDLFLREKRLPRSILVRTKSKKSQIKHTNNW